MGTTETGSFSPGYLLHAYQLFEPRCPFLGGGVVWLDRVPAASSGTAAAPAPGTERGTEKRAKGNRHQGRRDCRCWEEATAGFDYPRCCCRRRR
jgi:hypothetical protein